MSQNALFCDADDVSKLTVIETLLTALIRFLVKKALRKKSGNEKKDNMMKERLEEIKREGGTYKLASRV